ncbi:MAG: alpha/beta hydrolase [archaeon]
MIDLTDKCAYVNVNGIKTRYIKQGKGENLIFISGFRSDIERFYGIIDFFSDHFTTYSLDFPGHGETGKLKGRHSLKKIAEFIKDWIKEIKLKKFHIVCASMGAPITMHLLQTDIDRSQIKKIYLLVPWASKSAVTFSPILLNALSKTLEKAEKSKSLQNIGNKIFNTPRIIKFVTSVMELHEVMQGTDLTYFSEGWKRFDFKICMETLHDTLEFDARKVKFRITDKKVYLIGSLHDIYLDFDKTLRIYKRIFPNIKPIYLHQKFHAPRIEITKDFCERNFNKVMLNILEK